MKTLKPFLILTVLCCAASVGCTAQDMQRAQTDLTQAQKVLSATTQATADAQAALDATRAVAGTQPSNARLQSALDTAQQVLSQATVRQKQAEAVLATAQSLLTSLQTQKPPDVTPLNQFGPYGELAGLLIACGWAVVKHVQASNSAKVVEAQSAKLDTIQVAAGATDHTTGVAAAVSALDAKASPAVVVVPPAAT